ncbi:long-chain fatty acid transport protein 2-like [Saccostrea cucullata]|uniref:long-chain fatty acid transport protein 2-like n=1 Tax=Saccostrea cuccullata TaxID=36930 RepID=UPI002ED13296
MPSTRDKVLMGLGGVAGVSVAAWQTMFPWIKYDLQYMKYGKGIGQRLAQDVANGRYIIDMFENSVAKFPKKPMIIFENREYTYEFINEQAKKVANIAYEWKCQTGDAVALICQNSPAFVWTFLGLQKIGLSVAFVNYNNKAKPLLHSLTVSKAKAVILGTGEELFHSVEEIRPELSIPIYLYGTSGNNVPEGYISMDDLMLNSPGAEICRSCRSTFTMVTPCIYIFTSGTTGLPKPAIVNQGKSIGYSKFLQIGMVTPDDRVYTTTPLYHSAATLALLSVMDVGATMILRVRFSASHYFEECRRHKVTIAQYIGELARYLLHVPESPEDGNHCIRFMIGNGLRADIWEKFQARFKIPKIIEFFGASEGTVAFVNTWGKVGACGRLSPFLNRLTPGKSYLVRYDPNTETPLRNKEGRCIPCKIGEPGLLIGGIPNQALYKDGFYLGGKAVNEKKYVRNAFQEGDAFFNYGDLMYVDKDYFLYFKDRVGDTFRWKGENVSTNEVANILTGLPFIQDANVYGVEIPGNDGRAGMAGILLKENVEFHTDLLPKIYHHCEENLPHYAQPLFLRFIKEMPLTTTHKQRKVEYVKEAYNPAVVTDPLFRISPETKTYVPLNTENIAQFLAKARL